MRNFCLVSIFILLSAAVLAAEDTDSTALAAIAGISEPSEREKALRLRLTGISSLEGRLLFLEEASQYETLHSTADGIRIELLLLSGRTEEAEELLAESGNLQSELGIRLAINHGRIPLSGDRQGALIPGLNLNSLEELSDNNPGSPEYFAARRGMIFSAAFLLSPEAAGVSVTPGAEGQAVPASSEAVVSGQDSISIQVGAFSRQENAAAHLEYLADRGISAEILVSTRQDGDRIYKTVISGIPKSFAQEELVRLKEKGIEGFILH